MEGNTKSPPGVFVTLLLLVGVVVFMAGLLGLYAVTGIGQTVFGFIFLLYWAAILRQAPKAYLETICGGITGILLAAFTDHALALNTAMVVLQYFSIAALLFLYMRRSLGLIVNNATMLYMILATIPAMDPLRNYRMMIGGMLVGALYMGAVSLAAGGFRSWSAARSTVSPGDGAPPSGFVSDPKSRSGVT